MTSSNDAALVQSRFFSGEFANFPLKSHTSPVGGGLELKGHLKGAVWIQQVQAQVHQKAVRFGR